MLLFGFIIFIKSGEIVFNMESITRTYGDVEKINQKDFYNSTGKKIGDFVLGFFIGLIVISSGIFFNMVLRLIGLSTGFGGVLNYLATPNISLQFLLLGLLIFIIIKAFKKKRRFIGIGIIIAMGLPILLFLLLFGACLVIIGVGGVPF